MFWSAVKMAEMGEQVLREMERLEVPSQRFAVDGSISGSTTVPRSHASKATISIEDLEAQPADLTNFEDLLDLDLFGQFDPSFDVDAYDAALGGGFLDLSLPPNFGEL